MWLQTAFGGADIGAAYHKPVQVRTEIKPPKQKVEELQYHCRHPESMPQSPEQKRHPPEQVQLQAQVQEQVQGRSCSYNNYAMVDLLCYFSKYAVAAYGWKLLYGLYGTNLIPSESRR